MRFLCSRRRFFSYDYIEDMEDDLLSSEDDGMYKEKEEEWTLMSAEGVDKDGDDEDRF